MKRPPAGRIFAYFGVLLGLSISTTINVMHATRFTTEWWMPWLDGSWPFLLLIALEVLTRIRWGVSRARYVAWGGLAVVAVVAAVESYWNLRTMMIAAHKETVLATIGPLGIDGFMAICASALLVHDGSTHDAPPASAEPVHGIETAPAGAVQPPVVGQPTELAHPVNVQVSAPPVQADRPKAPVSPDAVGRVLRAVRSGQPMGKGAIVAATGMGRSTVTRAVDHLVEVGQLRAIGDPRRPDYVLAHQPAEAAQ